MAANPAQYCSARCSDFQPGEVVPFDPEPDLAGIGVILSFMITLICTILITWVASVMVDLFCYSEGDYGSKFSVSAVSERSRIVREKIDNTAKGRRLRRACFITLIFSDQQLIVGTSLLTAAYIKHCTLTQYHFEVAGLLSLCSFRTFQFAAAILAGTLRSNFSKGWRLFWVTAVASMMLVTNIFRMNAYFLQPFGSPLYCLSEVLAAGAGYGPLQAARLAYTILTEVVVVYCRCVLRLFPSMYSWRPFKRSISGLQRILLLPGKKHLEALDKSEKVKARLFWLLTFFSIMVRYLLSSTAMELGAVTAIFVRVMWLVWTVRDIADEQGRQGSEDDWGFGQLLPLFLLALPVTTLAESLRSPWEISSSPAHPQPLREDTTMDEKANRATRVLSQTATKPQAVDTFASSSSAASHPEPPKPLAKRVRSLSTPDIASSRMASSEASSSESAFNRKNIMEKLVKYSKLSSQGPSALEASPRLEDQNHGGVYDADREWQDKVERYEGTYLKRGMFQMWIFIFNIGILMMHTLIILPSPYA